MTDVDDRRRALRMTCCATWANLSARASSQLPWLLGPEKLGFDKVIKSFFGGFARDDRSLVSARGGDRFPTSGCPFHSGERQKQFGNVDNKQPRSQSRQAGRQRRPSLTPFKMRLGAFAVFASAVLTAHVAKADPAAVGCARRGVGRLPLSPRCDVRR